MCSPLFHTFLDLQFVYGLSRWDIRVPQYRSTGPALTKAGAKLFRLEHKTKSAPLDRPSFTFIDHDDDLTSKRIKDVNARKAIRSHVMRDVRRRERLAGLKRTSRQNRGQNASKVVDSNEHSVVLRASSQSSNPTLLSDPDSLLPAIYQRGRPDRWSAGYPLPLHSTPNPPRTWFLDPFFTLPGTTRLASVVAPLLYHCKWYHSPFFLALWALIRGV